MPYYEYEKIVKNLIDILKEKQEAEEGSNKDHSSMNADSMMKQAGKYLPSGFNTNNPASNFKIPSYSPASFPSIPSSLKI